MRRFYQNLFLIVAALRFLCVPVFVIDDDEAWSSAASIAMKSPWRFYRSAVDHKPPGFVWFYWFVGHLVPCASDPRVVRAAFTLLSILAAGVIGWMAIRFERAKELRGDSPTADSPPDDSPVTGSSIGWCAATLFLLVSALPAPKLLAVTADGLIAIFVAFAYAVALFAALPAMLSAWIAGALLGCALLVKQTAVFFAIPILFARWPRKWSWKEIPVFAFGAACILVPCIFGLGVSDFFYWNWTYPKEVLVAVRSRLFESDGEGLLTLVFYGLAILPLGWVIARKLVRSKLRATLGDFRVLWILAGLCGLALGKALFLHYLLLIGPPVALLGAEALLEVSKPGRTFAWLGVQYLAGCLLLVVPASGVFWGTDLVYFQALGHVMAASLRPGEKAMVWGGSALPLAYADVEHVTRFVLPRFAVFPYATKKTSAAFHQELAEDPPELILDLHERGDNQFDNPISSEPFVENLVRSGYKLYVSESIPWAKFYFLHPPQAAAGLIEASAAIETAAESGGSSALYQPFPAHPRSWERLADLAKEGGLSGLRLAIDLDWALRARASLELMARQSPSAEIRERADRLKREIRTDAPLPRELRSEIEQFLGAEAVRNGGIDPVPMLSPAWWATVAMVELQPRVRMGAGR